MSAPLRHLVACEPAFAPVIARFGPPRLTPRRDSPYEALLRAIAHQQLHGRAAEAILGRLVTHCGGRLPEPDVLAALPEAELRAIGFSRAKIAALRDLAAKTLEGVVPSRRAAARLSDEALIARLTTLRGVGRWTVEMLLIFTLGRPDVLPVDDFGIREGVRHLTGAATPPPPKAVREWGAPFAPFRTTVSWYLWRLADAAKRIPPLPPPS
jgi:DNA-3-methyladenine glycosylase II